MDFDINVPKIERYSESLETKAIKKEVNREEGIFSRIFNKKKLLKSRKIAVILLRNNGIAEPQEVETRDGSFEAYGRMYHEDKDCIFSILDKKTGSRMPLIIIFEWDLLPLGTKKWEDKEMREKFSELQDHVLKGIRTAELARIEGSGIGNIDLKKVIGWGLIILIGGIIAFNFIPH